MSTHYIEKCSCGTILGQCRCPATNKPVRISKEPCPHVDTTGAAKPSPEEILESMTQYPVRRVPVWEQGGIILLPFHDGSYETFFPVSALRMMYDANPDAAFEDIMHFVNAAESSAKQTVYESQNFKHNG